MRCMLVILLRNAGPERPGSRDQDLSALDLAHEPLPGQACRKVYAPNKATESGLSLSHFVSLSIFIGFHQPAYRGVVHAEMLRNRRHRMPSRQIRKGNGFIARVVVGKVGQRSR